MLPIKQFVVNRWYKWFPREMVSYWKTKDSVAAKVMEAPEGHYIMQMEGEKYPFPGFPRGVVLFGTLSKLKHEIKNQFFNDAWHALERGEEIVSERKLMGRVMENILMLTQERRMNMVPYERMVPPVKEIWRAWTVLEEKITDYERKKRLRLLKECVCFILQEDDAYRFRVQWLAKFFPRFWSPKLKHFDFALKMLEHAEVVGDMKERIRLLRRIVLAMLEDGAVRHLFNELVREIDWKKVRMTKADKYFFRAKYFKVDYPEFQY